MPQPNKLNRIGERIYAVKNRHGLSSYRVAKNAKMDYSQFHRMTRGNVRPTRESLIRVCKALGATEQEVAEIFAETNYRAPSAEDMQEEDMASILISCHVA